MFKIYSTCLMVACVLIVLFQSCAPARFVHELPVKNEHSRESQD